MKKYSLILFLLLCGCSYNQNKRFIVKDAYDDNNQQIKDIQDLILQGIDLLIVSPDEAQQLTSIVEEVSGKGIPVIDIDGLNTPDGGADIVPEGSVDGTILYLTGWDNVIQLALRILTGIPFEKNVFLSTYRIGKTNARTIWLQSEQIRSQQQKIDNQVSQLDTLSSTIRRQNSLLLLTSVIIILLVIMVFIVYVTLRHKNRLNTALDTMNKTIKIQNSIITRQRDDLMNQLIIAEEAKETKMHLLTGISHEFRSAVTLIANPIDNLIGSLKDEAAIKKLEIVRRSCERLKRISAEILKFRKIDENKYQLRFCSSNIAKFVFNIVETFHQRAQLKNIKLVTEIPLEIYAEFDLEVIEKVMYNLLSNALIYTNEYGTISVSVKLEDSKVCVKVSDTGIGIQANELPYLFNRFYKTGNSKLVPENEGPGIGLALSKELIQLHNGQIDVYSSENQGTTFSVTIPQFHLIIDRDQNVKPAEQFEVRIEPFQNHNKKKTVLIVEEDADMLVVITDIVGKEYNVITAYNGKEGLEKIKAQSPDIVVSDILMPVMDGMQLCIEIKKNPITCHIPVILFSALDSQETTVKCLDIGADAYITQPLNEFLLLSQIKNLIDSREKLKIAFYPSVLEKDTFKTIGFTDKEFLNKCIEFIYEDIENADFSLDSLAVKMNISRSSLYRKIRKLSNLKPVDFIKKTRLNYAAKLLLSKNISVNEIAWRSGFSDPKYFSKCFFQEFKCNPKKYSVKQIASILE